MENKNSITKKIIIGTLLVMSTFVTACSQSEGAETITPIGFETESIDQAGNESPTTTEEGETEVPATNAETATKENTTIESSTVETQTDEITTSEEETEVPTTTMPSTETEVSTTVKEPTTEQTTESEIISEDELARQVARDILPNIINDNMTDLQKLIAIHDWILENLDYATGDYMNGTLYAELHKASYAMVNGYAVCTAYAKSFEALAEEAGFETNYVSGEALIVFGGGHAWNQVKLDGVWYNVDMTWDDPTTTNKPFDDHSRNNYYYFLMSDEMFYETHKVGNGIKAYECPTRYPIVDIIDSAYVRTGVFWHGNDKVDEFKEKVIELLDSGRSSFMVYFDLDRDWNELAAEISNPIEECFAQTKALYKIGSWADEPYLSMVSINKEERIIIAESEEEAIAGIKKMISEGSDKIWGVRWINSEITDENAWYKARDLFCKYDIKYSAICHDYCDNMVTISYMEYVHEIVNVRNDAELLSVVERVIASVDLEEGESDTIEYFEIRYYNDKIASKEEVEEYLRYFGYETGYSVHFMPSNYGVDTYCLLVSSVRRLENVCSEEELIKIFIEEVTPAKFFLYHSDKITEENCVEEVYRIFGEAKPNHTNYFKVQYICDGIAYIVY